jgi:hypothetical protein
MHIEHGYFLSPNYRIATDFLEAVWVKLSNRTGLPGKLATVVYLSFCVEKPRSDSIDPGLFRLPNPPLALAQKAET